MRYPSSIRRTGWAALFFGILVRLVAQDVTMAPLTWMDPQDAPDTLPVALKAPKFTFPAELKQTKEIGYAFADTYIDEEGKRANFYPVGNLNAYDEAAYKGIKELRFSPARRAARPVMAATQMAVIFNPKSAAMNTPDATPRLLAVTPVRVRKLQESLNQTERQVVYADVSVDETGRVIAVKNVAPEWSEAFLNTARQWRFAPARQAGRPVAADVHMPFFLISQDMALGLTRGKGKTAPPEVISRVPPEYPMAMRESGMRGEVVVDFILDREGRVLNPVVKSSLNPAFDEPAIEALRQWKFKPAWKDGVPVFVRMRQAMGFMLNDTPGGGSSGVRVRAPAWAKDLTAPVPHARAIPVYPYALLRGKVTGKARVTCMVGEDGKVTATAVTEATHPEFGRATQAAADLFEYSPALKDGRPVAVEVVFEQEFSPSNTGGLLTTADTEMVRQESLKPGTIVSAKQLDAPLQPISQRAPRFPTAMARKADKGEAVVEIIVDGEGRVRLPRIISASDEAFGYAAMQAVVAWRFEPPKAQGKRATVRARVPFNFEQTALVPAEAPQK